MKVTGFHLPFTRTVSDHKQQLHLKTWNPQTHRGSPNLQKRKLVWSHAEHGHQGHTAEGPTSPPWFVTQSGKFTSLLSFCFPTAAVCRGTNSGCWCKNKQIAVTLQITQQANWRGEEAKAPGAHGGCGCGKWWQTQFSQQYQCSVSTQKKRTRTSKSLKGESWIEFTLSLLFIPPKW